MIRTDMGNALPYVSVLSRSRKAVLTTCTLLPPPRLLVAPGKRPSFSKPPKKRAEIPCCFSFTVQRDSWGVPVVVMGQFMAIAI